MVLERTKKELLMKKFLEAVMELVIYIIFIAGTVSLFRLIVGCLVD